MLHTGQLQVVVFKNLFLFSPLCAEVTELLLSSIKDLNIEVCPTRCVCVGSGGDVCAAGA